MAPFGALAPITSAGQNCLALTLITVVWCAAGVAQPAYVSTIYLALLILTGTSDTATVFASWTKMQMWMVIGAHFIAAAVKDSGLGERIAYWFALKFARGWTTLVVSIFSLTAVLSLLIAHSLPRAFMILAIMLGICVPAFLSFIAGSGISSAAVTMMVFTAINIHYILPFHNLTILVGEGAEACPIAVVFVAVVAEALWFNVLGLM